MSRLEGRILRRLFFFLHITNRLAYARLRVGKISIRGHIESQLFHFNCMQ